MDLVVLVWKGWLPPKALTGKGGAIAKYKKGDTQGKRGGGQGGSSSGNL